VKKKHADQKGKITLINPWRNKTSAEILFIFCAQRRRGAKKNPLRPVRRGGRLTLFKKSVAADKEA